MLAVFASLTSTLFQPNIFLLYKNEKTRNIAAVCILVHVSAKFGAKVVVNRTISFEAVTSKSLLKCRIWKLRNN